MKESSKVILKVTILVTSFLLIILLGASLASASPTYNLVFGGGYAAASGLSSSTTQQFSGSGAWYELYPSTKTDMYIDPVSTFGASFTIDEIQSITYHTVNGATNPSNVDFYMLLYTQPCTGGDASWYCHRLTAEPMYAVNYQVPSAWVWNTFTTDSGTNQLTFYDAIRSGTLGFYGAPTLQQIQAGAIDWSTYITGGSTTPVDYGGESIKYITFSTGSGWASFEGYLDAITITLTGGAEYIIDLENFADPLYVDDDWTGSSIGEEVATAQFYGWNAFATIQDAINNAVVSGTINVYPGTYDDDEANGFNAVTGGVGTSNFNIFVNKPVTIQGVKADGSVITDPGEIGAYVIPKRDTPLGNLSTFFVQADNVTISGLDVTAYDDPLYNFKTISVIGNNVTIKDSVLHAKDQVSSIYMYDPRYNASTDTSYITSYTITGNELLAEGIYASGIRLSSGPGWTGDASNRVIANNMVSDGSYGIEFVGPGGDAWDVYPVGAATISGNTFSNQEKGSVAAWGIYNSVEGYGAIDWDGILASNIFDKAVITKTPVNIVRYYDSGNFKFVRGIYSDIQRYPVIWVAQAGDTIEVMDGIYEEQVVLDGKTLSIVGESLNTIIKAPVMVPTCFTTSSDKKPIICIKNSSVVTLDKLTIDGAGRGNANYQFIGVAFSNAAGTIKNSTIKDIRDTPFSGAQHGVGIYAYNTDEISRTIHVIGNTLTGFQKNAMAINAGDTTPLMVDIQGNMVTGAGATTVTAQNGIQVLADLGSGSIDGNTVSGIAYDNTLSTTKWVATSILNFYADLDITDNIITGAHMGIYNIDGAGDITGNQLTIEKVGVYAYGIIATDPPEAVPSPYGIDQAIVEKSAGSNIQETRATDLVLNVSNNTVTFSGTDNTTTFGIEADAGYGPDDLDVTINNNIVTGFEVGIELYKCESSCDTGVFTNLVAQENCLSDNTWGMRSNVPEVITNGTSNWWGSEMGPFHPTLNPLGTGDEVSNFITFTPWLDACGGDPVGGQFQNTTTLEYFATIDQAVDDPDTVPGHTIIPTTPGPFPVTSTINKNGITIDLMGTTFTGGSPAFIIAADDVTIQNGILDGWTGSANNASAAVVVNAGADNFRLLSTEVLRWKDGLELQGSVTSFKVVSNWFHGNTESGLQVNPGVVLTGVITIEGNLFKENGGPGIQNDSGASIEAEYNSWGHYDGPSAGDGVSSLVDFEPWTFLEPYIDMVPDTNALVRNALETETFNVALKVDTQMLYGLAFKITWDTTKLNLNSTTFNAPWIGKCASLSSTAGELVYRCNLDYPTTEYTAFGGTILTMNFTPRLSGLIGNGPWETYFNISHLPVDTNAGAVGGVKIWVNNAGYGLPSVTTRDITDTDDGKLVITGIANYTGYIDLEGRSNDSGALIQVWSGPLKGSSTVLANATSASGGAYTTVHLSPNVLTVGNIYYLYVDRDLYLPTTIMFTDPNLNPPPAIPDEWAHSKLLSIRPLTPVNLLLLLGGDAVSDNLIDILDAGCIGNAYSTVSPNASTCGGQGSSDVTGDTWTNILDLTLMGGNFTKNYSPWNP